MNARWSIAAAQPETAQRLAAALNVSPLLARCLLNRGLADPAAAAAFLQPSLKQLADPFLLPQMRLAVDRLWRARETAELVVIFGDFDVDGITSTALLLEVLGGLGWLVNAYLPHRLDEGYGLSAEGVEHCLAKFPAALLLAVDCGSTAVTTIAQLRQRGVDVLVFDHHQVADPPPEAVALVNPHAPGATAFRELSAVGLAFKLAHALVKQGRALGLAAAVQYDVRTLLDWVALGTIADLVPLTGENRILVTAGLARLSATQRPGLQALKAVAQTPAIVGTYEVGFQLGPRLNAAGRLENAEAALRLLLARDRTEADPLARALDAQNRERQQIEHAIVEEVLADLHARFNPQQDWVIVEGQPAWHLGVVGIVAARVLRTFHRPTFILGRDGPDWRGSGRSIPGFDLAAALDQCHDLLVRHGGHALAAGVTVRTEQLDPFRARLNQLARLALRPEQLIPTLRLDSEVEVADLEFERIEELARLNPHGTDNPPVQCVVRAVRHQRPPQRMGKDRQHSRWWIAHNSTPVEAVGWNLGQQPPPEGPFDLAFEPRLNEFNGRRYVQLRILDWRPAETAAPVR